MSATNNLLHHLGHFELSWQAFFLLAAWQPLSLGRMQTQCPLCGTLMWETEATSLSSTSECCKGGQVQLEPLPTPLPLLQLLMVLGDWVGQCGFSYNLGGMKG